MEEARKELVDVESVQALASASKNLTDIPERYIRPDIATEAIIVVGGDDIPVIDLGRLLDPVFADDEEAKLKVACEEWGFFQLINHGVPGEVIENMKNDVKEFFDLPIEEKNYVKTMQGGTDGYGKKFVVSGDQKLDWGDAYFLMLQPPTVRNMRFWSTRPSTIITSLGRYSDELMKVTYCLLKPIAKNLGIQPEKLLNIFGDMMQNAAMHYYPPCPVADKVIGMAPHSDRNGLTLLLEVNEVSGFQIRRNEGWLPVKSLPGAFIVNIGDMLEIMSNGKYKSIEHRATVNPEKERMSIATFHSLSYGAVIGPIVELVGGDVQRYKSMTVESFLRLTKLDGKSILDQMKI